MPKIDLLNIDCMDYMAGLDDNAFDLAIVDPPYGIGMGGAQIGEQTQKHSTNIKIGIMKFQLKNTSMNCLE